MRLVGPHDLECLLGRVSGNQRYQHALVGHVERIESQHLAGGFHRPRDGERPLLQHHADAGRGGNFVEGT